MDETKNPVWMAVWPTVLVVGFGLACGAGGATFGENSPGNAEYGGGTYLDDARVPEDAPVGTVANGSLAVDPDTEYAYTMQLRSGEGRGDKRLVVVPPGEDPRVVMDLTGYTDVRILFPPESVLVMAQPDPSHESVGRDLCRGPDGVLDSERSVCADDLFWFDKGARQKIRELKTNARYHGTRLSPKRNYLAVADNFQDGDNIHLLDTQTGETNVIPNSEGWFEGMWLHEEDVLVTASFECSASTASGGQVPVEHLRIREWSPRNGSEQAAPSNSTCFYDEAVGELPEDCDVMVPGIKAMWITGFSWIGVSPDDRWLAVPARRDNGHAVVVVVDRHTQELHLLEDTHGPVGFTPDSKRMIGFGFADPNVPDNLIEELTEDPGDDPFLAIVDLETMEMDYEPTPGNGVPTFFVSHDSADVVVANAGTGESMLIVDLDAGTAERMAGSQVAVRGRLADRASDPSSPDYVGDLRRLSASNLVESRTVMSRVEPCHDRVCHGEDGVRVGLGEFVSRRGHQELWLLEASGLLRVDLARGYSESVPLDQPAAHINIQPKLDRLVLDTPGELAIRSYDPARRRVESTSSISFGWGSR